MAGLGWGHLEEVDEDFCSIQDELLHTVSAPWAGWRRPVRVGMSRAACALLRKVLGGGKRGAWAACGESVFCQKVLYAVLRSRQYSEEPRVLKWGLKLLCCLGLGLLNLSLQSLLMFWGRKQLSREKISVVNSKNVWCYYCSIRATEWQSRFSSSWDKSVLI